MTPDLMTLLVQFLEEKNILKLFLGRASKQHTLRVVGWFLGGQKRKHTKPAQKWGPSGYGDIVQGTVVTFKQKWDYKFRENWHSTT